MREAKDKHKRHTMRGENTHDPHGAPSHGAHTLTRHHHHPLPVPIPVAPELPSVPPPPPTSNMMMQQVPPVPSQMTGMGISGVPQQEISALQAAAQVNRILGEILSFF